MPTVPPISTKSVLANLAAYDVYVPYTDLKLLTLANPGRGDLVLFQMGTGISFKRLVGLPGDTVKITGGCLQINGVMLQYKVIEETPSGVLEKESGMDMNLTIRNTTVAIFGRTPFRRDAVRRQASAKQTKS